MTQNLVGLARVATSAQDAQLARDALKAVGCIKIFVERISNRATHRPELAGTLEYMPDDIDSLVVWKLDRLGRSTTHILTVADDLSDGASVYASPWGRSPAPTARRRRGGSSSR